MKLRKSLTISILALFPDASNAAEFTGRDALASFPPKEVSEVGFVGVAPAPPSRRKPRPRNITGIGVAPAPRSRPTPPPNPPPQIVLNAIANWSGIFIEGIAGDANNGGVLGAQIGTYSQRGQVVIGFSGGIDRHIGVSPFWTGTALARLGYAASDRFLPYISFGAALSNSLRLDTGENSTLGWTVGIGFDYRLNLDWSVVGAFNYYSFNDPKNSFAGPVPHLSYGELRAGIKYHLPTF